MLLAARDISKSLGLRQLFAGVSVTINPGDRLGLIGPNGAGKSTLLKILAGELDADDGVVTGRKGIRAVYVPQQDRFAEEATPREILTEAALRSPQAAHAVHDPHEAELVAAMVLDRLGFDDARADAHAGRLSGGWRKRLAIARGLAACAGEPDLLLLDEPTNHLDFDGIRWLESLLTRGGSAGGGSASGSGGGGGGGGSGGGGGGSGGGGFSSVFVTHDRAFLESAATRIAELSAAYPQGLLLADGNYTEFLRRKSEFLDGQARAQQALANQVRIDLAWLARGPQARRTKSKSRIVASHARIDQLAELSGRNTAAGVAGARVDFDSGDRRTKRLIGAKGIAKSLGGRALFQDVDVELGVGDCLGLLGPNGSGKTTLIRVLTGELAPDAGAVSRSEPPPRVAVFSQHRRELDPQTTLREALSPVDQVRFRGQPMHITAWSRRFLFRDEQLQQPVGSLSGGELARVHIAGLMLQPCDVLVLDEPTNDLDIPTLETLEAALEDFPGAILLVTHDRAMLAHLATEILALDGRGGARPFATIDQALAAQAQDAKAARAAAASSASPSVAAAPPAPTPARKKLTYAEQRDFDTIEARIAEAEAKAAACEARLAEPAVSADHQQMARACADLSRAQAEVAALYARWEELEAKRA